MQKQQTAHITYQATLGKVDHLNVRGERKQHAALAHAHGIQQFDVTVSDVQHVGANFVDDDALHVQTSRPPI
jgi:hypothetical protein